MDNTILSMLELTFNSRGRLMFLSMRSSTSKHVVLGAANHVYESSVPFPSGDLSYLRREAGDATEACGALYGSDFM